MTNYVELRDGYSVREPLALYSAEQIATDCLSLQQMLFYISFSQFVNSVDLTDPPDKESIKKLQGEYWMANLRECGLEIPQLFDKKVIGRCATKALVAKNMIRVEIDSDCQVREAEFVEPFTKRVIIPTLPKINRDPVFLPSPA